MYPGEKLSGFVMWVVNFTYVALVNDDPHLG
jgi:hypothetical protein